jgi:hypothetical protein
MRLQYRKRDPKAGIFKCQTQREQGKRATHARHAEASQDQAVGSRKPDRAVKEKVDRQHDRANRSGGLIDARERETLEFRRDAAKLGVPPRGKPFGKRERRNLRKAKADRPELYAALLIQYSDPTRR